MPSLPDWNDGANDGIKASTHGRGSSEGTGRGGEGEGRRSRGSSEYSASSGMSPTHVGHRLVDDPLQHVSSPSVITAWHGQSRMNIGASSSSEETTLRNTPRAAPPRIRHEAKSQHRTQVHKSQFEVASAADEASTATSNGDSEVMAVGKESEYRDGTPPLWQTVYHSPRPVDARAGPEPELPHAVLQSLNGIRKPGDLRTFEL